MNRLGLQRFFLDNPDIPEDTDIYVYADHGQNVEGVSAIQQEIGYYEGRTFILLNPDDVSGHLDEDLKKVVVIWGE